jgi:hypothetical protein
MMGMSTHTVVSALLIAALTGCTRNTAGEVHVPTPSAPVASTVGSDATPFAASDVPIAIEPGVYRIPRSDWSVADFTVTFPRGWTAQYGHVFLKEPDSAEEQGFYAVVVEDIFADACVGGDGRSIKIGPSVNDLAVALREQTGPIVPRPVETTFGGYPATRIDLSVPKGFDLSGCDVKDIGLRIWYSAPADKNFVLLRDAVMSVYIMDVNGERQVFLAGSRAGTSNADRRELQTVLDSVHVES